MKSTMPLLFALALTSACVVGTLDGDLGIDAHYAIAVSCENPDGVVGTFVLLAGNEACVEGPVRIECDGFRETLGAQPEFCDTEIGVETNTSPSLSLFLEGPLEVGASTQFAARYDCGVQADGAEYPEFDSLRNAEIEVVSVDGGRASLAFDGPDATGTVAVTVCD
ncbi:MAG: hypothetical protein GY898_30205 [Proteobacteria bacterium]|nr:hypothetical protein [Pseudomonadota bacterium]